MRHILGGVLVVLGHAASAPAQAPRVGDTDGTPWWTWMVAGVAGAAGTGFLLAMRRLRELDPGDDRPRGRDAFWKQQYEDVVERTSEIVAVHDREGRLVTLNAAGERATGYTRDELRAIEPGWVFDDHYLEMVSRLLGEGVDAHPRAFHSELRTRQGQRVQVEVQAAVVVDEGRVAGVTTLARDLGEREQQDAEWRQTQKMEAVGRLATGIAHDFNNLITVLLGYADDLLMRPATEREVRRSAEEIRHAAERAAGLTQQLLSFSRRRPSAPQTIDLNATVIHMEELLRRLLGADVSLAFELDPALGPVHIDPAQASQVIMNLAVNGRDAMPGGGTLTIETANVTLGSEHLDVIPGPHAMIAVHDTGIGMSDEVRKRLFDPFFTTKEAGRGTGIGLSLVQAIIRQNGGHIEVESEEGRGSVFRAYFPRVAEPQRSTATPADHPETTGGSGIVLLAEDDVEVRTLMARELSRRGFSVLPAEDGRAALEMAEAHGGRIDLLVTDIVMPRMGGVELAATLAAAQPRMKVLYVTGHPDRATVDDGPGAGSVLMKPFSPEQLTARVAATLEQTHG